MTPSQADAIWTVLVEECGASESERNEAVTCPKCLALLPVKAGAQC